MTYEVGTVLAGKYRIERTIGEGGMGTVVAATHLQLGSQIALKFLGEHLVRSENMVERFMREARASARLRSEHVCRVSDVEVLDTGVPFIVMELLAGEDLQTMLRTTGPLPVATAAEYVLQACVAIAEAHAAGIIHRDLKPGNLFCTRWPDGSPLIKVLDFGVAKAVDDFSLTTTASLIGSPAYMSPEQLKSSKLVDARGDIWSMGATLYELVSGSPPFGGESIAELVLAITTDPPLSLAGMPARFEAAIHRCLEKDPARRFQNVAELATALAEFAGPGGNRFASMVQRVRWGSSPRIETAPPQDASIGSNGSEIGRPRAWRLPALIGITVVAVAIAALVATTGGPGPEANQIAAPAAASPPKLASPPLPEPPPAQLVPPATVEPPSPVTEPAPPPAKPSPKLSKKPAKPVKPSQPREDVHDSRF